MSDWTRERTIGTLVMHAAFPNDGGLLDCVCGVENQTVTEHAEHVADALLAT